MHIKPIVKTGSCQAAHTGYFISGRMKVVMDDGEEGVTARGISPPWHPATTRGSSVTSPV